MFNKGKVRDLERKVRDLECELEKRRKLVDDNKELVLANTDLTSKYNENILKIRKQIEADIYFSCAKIMKDLEKGDKIAELQPQIDYMNKLRALQGRQGLESPSPFAQNLSGGFSGAMFGGRY